MPTEIERKFLVTSEAWRDYAAPPVAIRQGYLAITDRASVRVRIRDGEDAFLTVKSAGAEMLRAEVEVAVPVTEAEQLLTLRQGSVIAKRRYRVPFGGLVWEVDVFEGDNAGLVLAEVELPSADHPVNPPPWAGREVTGIKRYYNASLATEPLGPRGSGE